MRHRKAGLKLNRTASHRNAMFRNMVTSLFKYERIRTTNAKAKELRRWADRVITLAKRGDLHARRQVLSIVREKEVVHKLFAEAAEKFGGSAGGYTRVVKLGTRPGDAAPIALVELVVHEAKPKKKRTKKKTATKPAADKQKAAAVEEKAEPKADVKADAEAKAEKQAKKAKPGEAKTKKTAVKKTAEEPKKEVKAQKAAPTKETKPAAKKAKAADKKEAKAESKVKKTTKVPAAEPKTEKTAEKKSTAKSEKKDAEDKK